MDRMAASSAIVDPVVAHGDTDITVDEMDVTVGEFYSAPAAADSAGGTSARYRSARHLQRLTKRRKRCSTRRIDLLRENRKAIIDKVEILDRRATSPGQEASGSDRSESRANSVCASTEM